MDRKLTFIEELNTQLREYQLEKISLGNEKTSRRNSRLQELQAKQNLIDLGQAEASLIEDASPFEEICRWSSRQIKPEIERNSYSLSNPVTSRAPVKRNNLMLPSPSQSQSKSQYHYQQYTLRSSSVKQIPYLKEILQKLQTPTNKPGKKVDGRKVMTSARKRKTISVDREDLHKHNQQNIQEAILTKKLMGQSIKPRRYGVNNQILSIRNNENTNPIVYPIIQNKKQKGRAKQYQRISRKGSINYSNSLNPSSASYPLQQQNMNTMVHQKQLLQNLIKNTISNQTQNTFGNIQNLHSLNILGQYGNQNYFSSSFKGQSKKRSTLNNILS